jgi:hypothetical protein
MDDEQMYSKMEPLQSEDDTFGCYIEGHHDIEQFERVATAFVNDNKILPEDYIPKIRQGYYKTIPLRGYGLILHYSDNKMRGAKAIMEMQ